MHLVDFPPQQRKHRRHLWILPGRLVLQIREGLLNSQLRMQGLRKSTREEHFQQRQLYCKIVPIPLHSNRSLSMTAFRPDLSRFEMGIHKRCIRRKRFCFCGHGAEECDLHGFLRCQTVDQKTKRKLLMRGARWVGVEIGGCWSSCTTRCFEGSYSILIALLG